ncbi:hypothetical protein MMC30_006315 [Trapelia coarctata]|nr:hypothetical protein [Trapelia coarctata]
MEMPSTPQGSDGSNDHTNVTIDVAGDLLLQIKDSSQNLCFYYRVSSTVLRRVSSYFDTLLDPGKFSEGATFACQKAKLEEQYGEMSHMLPAELPIIHIAEIGPLFPTKTPNTDVITHLFNILHRRDSSHLSPGGPSASHIALLAAVADRFDAVRPVSAYVVKKGWHKDMKEPNWSRTRWSTKKSVFKTKEIFWRQRILAGAILGLREWVLHHGRFLIDSGSEGWRDGADLETTTTINVMADGPWWDLPYGIEEELAYRRECILATISSLQSHFLNLYARPSKQPHCRLGYASSPQCDSFQLGEMLRFFIRKGTLRLQSLVSESANEYTPSYSGSITTLLASLRDCPSYQVDEHHSHCGLRTRFMPLLDHVTAMLASAEQISVCIPCWRKHKSEHSWQENTVKEWWFRGELPGHAIVNECGSRHDIGRNMFTAERREWTFGE